MKIKFLFIGRPSVYKGFNVLINALSHIDESDWTLTVIGDFQNLKNIYSKNISFVGKKNNNEVANFLRNSDVVIIPSLYETFGNVALEAMACAKPIIASRTGGLIELIDDSKNGFLVEPNNVIELRDTINYFIHNPNIHKSMGENSFKKSKKYYWHIIAYDTNTLLRELL